MVSKQNGFTLVELAIALMVIGLLIGGVLKGQELIENARLTRMVKDINDYDAAIMIFRSTYNALPGDFRHPTRIPNCDYDPCHQPGNGDQRIIPHNVNLDESLHFWHHLYRAGMITKINESGNMYSISPLNAYGGHNFIRYFNPVNGHNPTTHDPVALNAFLFTDSNGGTEFSTFTLSCTVIGKIDQKMDDGLPRSGQVQVFLNTWGSSSCYDTDLQYTTSHLRTPIVVILKSLN